MIISCQKEESLFGSEMIPFEQKMDHPPKDEEETFKQKEARLQSKLGNTLESLLSKEKKVDKIISDFNLRVIEEKKRVQQKRKDLEASKTPIEEIESLLSSEELIFIENEKKKLIKEFERIGAGDKMKEALAKHGLASILSKL